MAEFPYYFAEVFVGIYMAEFSHCFAEVFVEILHADFFCHMTIPSYLSLDNSDHIL